ncbi:Chalcone domain-containing protein [Cephalotus follicularis]|uniref:Chalcone domain-containing protein n=1 Tax=Cephalotus follicularis TaxID=3775 RepID=A0A1Q3APU8_CEPFO|nr:Chalcone domain-containing protein [Cephalotus follicularis]
MVSLRFPLLFFEPARQPSKTPSNATFAAITIAASAAGAAFAGIAATQNPKHPFVKNALKLLFPNHPSPLWGSLSLADNSASLVEPKSGASFPSVLADSKKLVGVGLRKKSVFGLKNIDVYAFGVYADADDVKKFLSEKYGDQSVEELKGNNELSEDLMEADIRMTVRLQIVYSKLSIRSVRSAFEDSVGSRLQKFGGSDNKGLLQRFASQFKDEYKIPRGSLIDLSRERGHVLCTTIDGKEVGSIQSKVLCRSLFDLYIGESPFDRQAKEDVQFNVASLLQK